MTLHVLELEFKVVVSLLMWVLRRELSSLEGIASSLKAELSLQPRQGFFLKIYLFTLCMYERSIDFMPKEGTRFHHRWL